MYKNKSEVKPKRRFSWMHILLPLVLLLNSFLIYSVIDDKKDEERYRSAQVEIDRLTNSNNFRAGQIEELTDIIAEFHLAIVRTSPEGVTTVIVPSTPRPPVIAQEPPADPSGPAATSPINAPPANPGGPVVDKNRKADNKALSLSDKKSGKKK